MSLPMITRKMDKGLPQYEDAQESDVFILSGAEDLIPTLVQSAGQWSRDVIPSRARYGKQYVIHRYRPRVDTLFARIERWINLSDPTDTFWRSINKDNVTTWYGKTAASRIADPAHANRIFSWLICESYDDKGNVARYDYKHEDSLFGILYPLDVQVFTPTEFEDEVYEVLSFVWVVMRQARLYYWTEAAQRLVPSLRAQANAARGQVKVGV